MRNQTYLTLLFLVFWASSFAQTQYIGPNNGNWFTAANWNAGLPTAGNNALIGGSVTVVVGSPLTVNFEVTAFGNITASAAVTVTGGGILANSGTFAIAPTGSLTNNATAQNFGTMTFAGNAGFTNGTSANFTNGGSLSLQAIMVNQGTLINNGTIDATNGMLQSGGSLNNNQVLRSSIGQQVWLKVDGLREHSVRFVVVNGE